MELQLLAIFIFFINPEEIYAEIEEFPGNLLRCGAGNAPEAVRGPGPDTLPAEPRAGPVTPAVRVGLGLAGTRRDFTSRLVTGDSEPFTVT